MLDPQIGKDLFVHRAIQADRSILGWDLPVAADESVLTNHDDSEDEVEHDEDAEQEEHSQVNSDEQYNQLLLCLHSFDDIIFGDGGALIFWLPYKAIPKDPEHCDPSRFKFKYHLDN